MKISAVLDVYKYFLLFIYFWLFFRAESQNRNKEAQPRHHLRLKRTKNRRKVNKKNNKQKFYCCASLKNMNRRTEY